MVFILAQFLPMVCKLQHISLFSDMTLASKVEIKNLNSYCKLVKWSFVLMTEGKASVRSKVLALLLYYLLFNVLYIVSSPELLSCVVCRRSSIIASMYIS